MHITKTIANFLYDKDYFISIWHHHIHLYGFLSINTLTDTSLNVSFKDFSILIKGNNFRVLKLTYNEVLLDGILEEVRMI